MTHKVAAKSYWASVACSTDGDKRAIRSWFSPLCDGMEPEQAEILCDIETDREKKIRVVFKDKNGKYVQAVRTKGKQITITLKNLDAAQ